MKKVKVKKAPKLHLCHCNQCGYDWKSKKKYPLHCAACISDKWNRELVGKKLRKAVPSRLGRGAGKKAVKGKATGKRARKRLAAPTKGIIIKDRGTSGKPSAVQVRARKAKKAKPTPEAFGEAFESAAIKPPRAPRVKKEKGVPATPSVEGSDAE